VNFCAQRPESLLFSAAKHPGRQAQKQIEVSAYELQAAQRLMYSFMIDTIHTRIWDGPHSDDDVPDKCDVDSSMMTRDKNFQSTGQATFGCVHRDKLGKEYQYKVDWDTRTHTDLLMLPIALMEFLFDSFKGVDKIAFCTKYKQDVHTF
jgi:hypothetical protein